MRFLIALPGLGLRKQKRHNVQKNRLEFMPVLLVLRKQLVRLLLNFGDATTAGQDAVKQERKPVKKVLMTACVAALVGCGGGGSDAPEAQAPAQIQSLEVWKSFLSTDRTIVTRGSGSDGASYEISTTIRPKGAAQFGRTGTDPLGTYNTAEVINTVKRNGAAYSTTATLFYVSPTDFSIAALIDPDGTTTGPSCIAPESQIQASPVPATAQLNASGRLFSGASFAYSGATNRCTFNYVSRAPSHSLTWSYESDGGKPLFCVNYATSYPGDNRLQSSCFEVVNTSAVGSGARISLSVGALKLTTKNY